MSAPVSLVAKLQVDAANPDIPVSTLLRSAKIIAAKLDLKDALGWIDRELDGYMDVPAEELPKYRQLTGIPKGYNPYHGWQPIHFRNAEQARVYSRTPMGQALGAMEEGLRDGRDGTYMFSGAEEARAALVDSLEIKTDVQIFLNYAQLYGVIDAVRNLVLNWSLQLEKAGIVGENMTFTPTEKKEATAVTHQFFIQNVGVLGNVSDQATVKNKQTANLSIDAAKVADFIDQARQAIPLLPPSVRTEVETILNEAEVEAKAKAGARDPSNLRRLLERAKSVCEGAAGNLAAEGIVRIVTALLGG